MKKATLLFSILFISFVSFAQDFEVPENVKLETVQDYETYKPDALKCIDWLMNTPINEQEDKRTQAGSFMIKWLSGTPEVKINMDSRIVTFMGSPDLFMIFMCGWAKYTLETKDIDNKVANSLAGIEAVIEFYQKNTGKMDKDKNVEEYIKKKEKGKLKEFVEKNAQ